MRLKRPEQAVVVWGQAAEMLRGVSRVRTSMIRVHLECGAGSDSSHSQPWLQLFGYIRSRKLHASRSSIVWTFLDAQV